MNNVISDTEKTISHLHEMLVKHDKYVEDTQKYHFKYTRKEFVEKLINNASGNNSH